MKYSDLAQLIMKQNEEKTNVSGGLLKNLKQCQSLQLR